MTLPLTLSTKPLEYPAMDYAFLRAEGIRILERLGGQLWTDFNAHDPGITILEQICFAITDLAYRIDYDVKDILTCEGEDPYRSLPGPAQVLPIHPVTLTDLRKLVIDVSGVKNAWFERVEYPEPGLLYDSSQRTLFLKTTSPQPANCVPVPIQGVYRTLLEIADNSESKNKILEDVDRCLQACRPLCQDFLYPTILPRQGIMIKAMLEVSAIDDPEWLLARVYYALAGFISPRVHFYTLDQMLARGKSIDEIMTGPQLRHGFIDDVELEKFGRKAGLRTSDLIQEILNVQGCAAIDSISVSDGSNTEAWYLKLDPSSTPALDIENSLRSGAIHLTRRGVPVQVNLEKVKSILFGLQQAALQPSLPDAQLDISLPAGRDRKIGRYHSIQRQFPVTYGIDTTGLPESASDQRKGQAKQLKAYLLFFDQLLSNYFAQLASTRTLFSFYSTDIRTYFSQVVADEGLGLDKIYVDPATHAANVAEFTDPSLSKTKETVYLGRRNRFLNHLLARFAEEFTDYSLLLYARLGEQNLIDAKCAFLQDYAEIGVSRGRGFDYTQPSSGTTNISGLEKRIRLKLGIPALEQILADRGLANEGDFYMLEHLLLRPSRADDQQWQQAAAGTDWQASALLAEPACDDPYSRQISFIFPSNWIQDLEEEGLPDLIHKIVREETPAHIRVYLHWLDQDQMKEFEVAYQAWLKNMLAAPWMNLYDVPPSDGEKHRVYLGLRDARDRILQVLGLGIPYPLRDLDLDYPKMVGYGDAARIQIIGSQLGVSYRLCDEDGNPIDNESTYEVRGEAETVPNQIFLTTPVIQEDVTYTVQAVRDYVNDQGENARLETYLNQRVSIRVGIDDNLTVEFLPLEDQVVDGDQITIDYGDLITVSILETQPGISYQLVTGSQDAPVTFSDPQPGNRGILNLTSSQGCNEDCRVNVRAYYTSSPDMSDLLDTDLFVRVKPNPTVTIAPEVPIVDYGVMVLLHLTDPQAGVEYELYQRELSSADYVLDKPDASPVIQTDEGRFVSIVQPEKITSWDALAGCERVGMFEESEGGLYVETGQLFEDMLFIVRAVKPANGEQIQLDRADFVLVRPNVSSIVDVESSTVERGATGMVTVVATQAGVAYQLRLNENNEPVNPPGYHVSDRGVERVRLEVDLVVESQGNSILLLPTDPITRQTAFNVLASKIVTGVGAQLEGAVTIGPRTET